MSEGLGITLRETCMACPEQYDAYFNGRVVGYLWLQHGSFTVRFPDAEGEIVYAANPQGDGCFEDHERQKYLDEAIRAIAKRLYNNANEAAP